MVVLIEDDHLLRRAVARLLEAHHYAVATYDSLGQFTSAGPVPQVGCAVLDLNLPGASGLEIQQKLGNVAPALSVVFLSGFGKVASTVRAMKAGALDFLEKPVEDAVLLQAVKSGVERSQRSYEEGFELAALRQKFQTLSARERQVLSLITSGLLNKQAAAELGLKEKTVKVHRAKVMAKMGADSFAELVRISQRLGLNR